MGRHSRRARLHAAVVRVSRSRFGARRARGTRRRALGADARRPGRARRARAHAVLRDRRPRAEARRRARFADIRVRRRRAVQARDADPRGRARLEGLLPGVPPGRERSRGRRLAAREARRMKLVTFGDEPRIGVLDGEEIAVLDVPTMREYFERGGADETGERVAIEETRLRAPIIPKKLLHTAGNFREHEEESKRVEWSHEIAPWIVFFQNVDAIVGPDEP